MNDGFVLIDKDIGMFSRDVDNAVSRLFGTRKVGHLGTLDPFASGLLVVAVNKGTKFLPYLEDEKKEYLASLKLGLKTSTGDPDGETIKKESVPLLSEDKIKEALSSFLGEGEQMPPMTSAIKMNGVPLYRLAHKGKEVERKKRRIFIYEIELLRYEEETIEFRCLVSKGTYVRVLGEDIASKLGTIGYLSSLRRTKIGIFDIKDSLPLNQVSNSSFREPTPYITQFPQIEADEEMAKDILEGRLVFLHKEVSERVLFVKNGLAIGIYRRIPRTRCYKCERGLF